MSDSAALYPIKGLYFFFWRENRTVLWERVSKFAVEVGFSSMAILGTIAGFTFHAQRDLLLENLPEFVDHTLGTVGLLLIETAIPVRLLFHKHHQMIHESLFMDVLELQGVNVEPASPAELQWIMEEKEIQKLQNQEAAGAPTNPRRQSRVIANLSAMLIDPETMNSYPKVKYFLTLPLNFIPIVGQALFCWLNAMETATVLHHHYYANLKGLSREDEATVIHSRKAQYIEFGIVASLLTLLPGLNVILVLTNAIGAALWVADIEKALHSQE